jgi:hypothetical protein
LSKEYLISNYFFTAYLEYRDSIEAFLKLRDEEEFTVTKKNLTNILEHLKFIDTAKPKKKKQGKEKQIKTTLQRLFRGDHFSPEFKEKVLSFVPNLFSNSNDSLTSEFIVKSVTGLQLEEA